MTPHTLAGRVHTYLQDSELRFWSPAMCHAMLIETKAADRGPIVRRYGGEPDLRELLHDPIACALMAADKVDSSDVYALLRKAHGTVVNGDEAR